MNSSTFAVIATRVSMKRIIPFLPGNINGVEYYFGNRKLVKETLGHSLEKINDKIITVFSGKIGNCVEAADKILELIKT